MSLKKLPSKKKCEYCHKLYQPDKVQYAKQKYCSKKCKWAVKDIRDKELNKFKGGYNREVYIRLWVKAMGLDSVIAYCHYCNIELLPDHFHIDHKIPRGKLTMTQSKNIKYLVVSCLNCNKEKSDTDYDTFIKRENGRD
jgi:hypothetical protein|tara:strand:+ start:292 stop:708 length:417 start_codon:yes stop_codon:yes gene_type:complete